MKQKVKEGAAAIYTVVFFCLLIGIVTLGFVGIMLQDILGSTNYDLSQSAYDSALAGVEDAKVLLLQYNSCVTNTNRVTNCNSIMSKVNAKNSSEDCDLVRDALGRASGEHETLVQSDNRNFNSASKDLDDSIDMAYTCVKLALATDDYLGTITESSDLKVIPLRTGGEGYGDGGAAKNFNRIRIEWFNSEDNRKAAQDGAGYVTSLPATSFGNAKTLMSGTGDGKWHSFAANSALPPAMRVNLIQADDTFKLSDFNEPTIAGSAVRTNRGTLLLRPTEGGTNATTTVVHSNIGDGLGGSALSGFDGSYYSNGQYGTDGSSYKTLNSPRDVKCLNSSNFATKDNEYACSVELDVPPTKGGGTGSNGMRFLMLSSLYAKPDVSFRVQLLDCPDLSANDSNSCSTVKFVGVQTKVDATGRANDLFRRVEARVELQDVNFPFVKYGLSSYGDGSSEGNIFKNYWATKNCWFKDGDNENTCDDFDIVNEKGNWE